MCQVNPNETTKGEYHNFMPNGNKHDSSNGTLSILSFFETSHAKTIITKTCRITYNMTSQGLCHSQNKLPFASL